MFLFMEDQEKEGTLTQRQEKFCELYTSQDKELFGNGVQTYLEVYDVDKTKPNWYDTACSAASRLLRNVKVIDKINKLLEEGGLNDQHVDKEILFLINQHADFGTKLGAIKEYNKLKQRIIEKKDVTSGGKPITVIQAHYGDQNPSPVLAETISDTTPQGDGQRDEESGDSVAPEKREGQDSVELHD